MAGPFRFKPMLVNTGRRTISREEELARTAAFLARHAEQCRACRPDMDDEEETLAVLAEMCRARPRRPLGQSQGVTLRRERRVAGDPEEGLLPVSGFPCNREKVGA